MATLQATSIGYALDVASAGAGVVHGVHPRAVNIEMRGDLWTLLAVDRSDLPFGMRTTSRDLAVLGVRRGDPVHVRSGFVGIGHGAQVVVDCRMAARWLPTSPDTLAPGLTGRIGVVATAARDRCWHGAAQMARDVMCSLHDPNALRDVLAQVVGRGPGLTPAGDDVLVGILAVLMSPWSTPACSRFTDALRQQLHPLFPTTTDVSGHLLRQATDGLFSRAVHELVAALIGGASSGLLETSARSLIETGATSGADTCAGILAAAPLLIVPRHERAAA